MIVAVAEVWNLVVQVRFLHPWPEFMEDAVEWFLHPPGKRTIDVSWSGFNSSFFLHAAVADVVIATDWKSGETGSIPVGGTKSFRLGSANNDYS